MGFANITPQVEDCLRESSIREGLVLVNAMHITASVFVNDDEPRRLKALQGFDLILVDESHNFRNPGTKRYRALMEVIRGGANPRSGCFC